MMSASFVDEAFVETSQIQPSIQSQKVIKTSQYSRLSDEEGFESETATKAPKQNGKSLKKRATVGKVQKMQKEREKLRPERHGARIADTTRTSPSISGRKRKIQDISKTTENNTGNGSDNSSAVVDDSVISAPLPKKPFKPADEASSRVIIDLTQDSDDEIEIHSASEDESAKPEPLTAEKARECIRILGNYISIVDSYKKIFGDSNEPEAGIIPHVKADMDRLKDMLMKQKGAFPDDCQKEDASNSFVGSQLRPASRAAANEPSEETSDDNERVDGIRSHFEHLLEQSEREKEHFRTALQQTQQELEQKKKEGINRLTISYPSTWVASSVVGAMYETFEGIHDVDASSSEALLIHEALFNNLPRRQTTVEVVSIKRNQNPHIWNKYEANKAHMSKKNGGVVNEKWMWHGTQRSALDAILKNGFDPRCAKDGGALGKGVYFAEKPMLSMQYTKEVASFPEFLPIPSATYRLLFCRTLEGKSCPGSRGLVRPPPLDAADPAGPAFDSCCGQLGSSKTLCVYYDHQCYPEYLVEIKVESPTPKELLRRSLAAVANTVGTLEGWSQVVVEKAKSLIEGLETEPDEIWGIVSLFVDGIARGQKPNFGLSPSQEKLNATLKTILQRRSTLVAPIPQPQPSLGAPVSSAPNALRATAVVIPAVMAHATPTQAMPKAANRVVFSTRSIVQPATDIRSQNGQIGQVAQVAQEKVVETLASMQKMTSAEMNHAKTCTICLNDLVDGDAYRLGKCSGHGFHFSWLQTCYEKMKKPDASFFKCPVCGHCYGERRGDQPKDGIMVHEVRSNVHLPGYESYDTIVIMYYLPSGVTTQGVSYGATTRAAYLPNNVEGQDILRRLKIAFERGLIFTVGTSVTTGAANTIVWAGIHHKTAETGGSAMHGYPDPTYLSRVAKELADRGVM